MSSMEQNGESQKLLCRSGCGFYGTPSHDGMCSKCYKDALKRKQQNPSPTQTQGVLSAPITPTASITDTVVSLAGATTASCSDITAEVKPTSSSVTPTTSTNVGAGKVTAPSCVDTGLPTITASAASSTSANEDNNDGGATDLLNADKLTSPESLGESPDTSLSTSCSSSSCDERSLDAKKPKKNRCHTCKKKVGLTGFKCRCEGLYCSTHRYSDKHECTFDYREMAQQQIRKSNPVVVGEKVNKI